MTIPFDDKKVHAKVDQLLSEKKFDKAAELVVAYSFARIPSEEIVKVLMDAIKTIKATNCENPTRKQP